MKNENDTSNFLLYGYFLDQSSMSANLLPDYVGNSSSLPEMLDSLKEKVYKKIKASTDFVVPLSGGVDSRFILALVAEVVSLDQVRTYTFGQKGSLDLEIGNLVAKKFRTKHVEFDLSNYIPDMNDVRYNLKKIKYACFTVMSTPYSLIDPIFGENILTFSGFMGDPLAGSKLKKGQFDPVGEFHRSNKITRFDATPDLSLLSRTPLQRFTEYESIDFLNRQSKYVKPHVMPNDNFYSPFLEGEFVGYFSKLEENDRYKCKHYFNVCLDYFPELFAVPVKNRYMSTLAQGEMASKAKFLAKIVSESGLNLPVVRSKLKHASANYFDYKKNLKTNTALEKDVKHRYCHTQQGLVKAGYIKEIIPYEAASSLEVSIIVSLGVIMESEL